MNVPVMPSWSARDLARWTGGAWLRTPARDPAGVSIDSRAVAPGNLFIAIPGPRFDGHDFVEKALAGGAAAAVVDTQTLGRFPADLPLLSVADTRGALTSIAAGHRDRIGASLIGVTGSVGKTTVKELTAAALAPAGPVYRSPGNWNNDIGLPLSLLGMDPVARAGVFELGMNRPGEIAALARLLRPGIGIVTPVGPAHLEAFPSEAAIAAEKSELLRALPADGRAILSLENPWFDLLAGAAPCACVTVSTGREADYRAESAGSPAGRVGIRERATGEAGVFELALPGRYFLEDLLLAVAAARLFGVPWDRLAEAVRGFRPAAMRWEVSRRAGVTWINDAYNANPMSMRAAARAFVEMPVKGGRWLVLGGMRELGPGSGALHRALGGDLANGPWAGLIACGAAAADVARGAREAGMDPRHIHPVKDVAAAVSLLAGLLQEGDAVLLKASRGDRLEQVLDAWAACIGSPACCESNGQGA